MIDVAIIGSGPAGLTAAIYAARAGLSTELFEMGFPGGQGATTNVVENYPGFPDGIGGPELGQLMLAQAGRFGVELRYEEVLSLSLRGQIKGVQTGEGVLEARAAILCMGAERRRLGLENERRFEGRGISYCATCDGNLYKGKDVFVVGGGDTAAEDALYLSAIASSVTLVHRRDTLRAASFLVGRIQNTKNIHIAYDTVISAVSGGAALASLTLSNVKTGEKLEQNAGGLFVAVGTQPNNALIQGQLALDLMGYVPAGEDCRTEMQRVYVAGDLRAKPLRQIVCAASDGAVAASMARADLY